MTRSQYITHDTAHGENTFSFRLNDIYALVIASLFVAIVSFNFLYPSPSGPPDNGDFNRIFASFSTGPVGHEFWPSLENQRNEGTSVKY